jgi:hypothetical protein
MGCHHAAEDVVVRGSNEFSCAPANVRAVPRPELSEATYDVTACGHVARYTCTRAVGYPLTCIRAPDPPVAPAPGEAEQLGDPL